MLYPKNYLCHKTGQCWSKKVPISGLAQVRRSQKSLYKVEEVEFISNSFDSAPHLSYTPDLYLHIFKE